MNKKINVENLHQKEESTKQNVSNKLLNIFIELFIVAILISIGSSAIVSGFIAIYFPCAGSICGEIGVAGGVSLTVGLILIFIAAVIILWANVLKD